MGRGRWMWIGLGVLALGAGATVQGAGFERGDLLVCDAQNDRVLRIDPATGALSVFSPPPEPGATNLLDGPSGIAILGDGTVYVVNAGDSTLVRIDPATGVQTASLVWIPGFPLGHFEPLYVGATPGAVVEDGRGSLHVAARGSNELLRILGLGTSGLRSELLASDGAFGAAEDLAYAGDRLLLASGFGGLWEITLPGGTLSLVIEPPAGKPVTQAGIGIGPSVRVGLFRGVPVVGGDCERSGAGLYELRHFTPVPGSPGFDEWVPLSTNGSDGIGPYDCPQSLAVVDDETFFVGDSNPSGGWVSKVVTGPQANVVPIATLPDGPLSALPSAIAVAPIRVPEAGGWAVWAAALGFLGAARLRRADRPNRHSFAVRAAPVMTTPGGIEGYGS